jgi:hypothetical protein
MSDAPQYGWEAPRNVLYLGLFTAGASVSPLKKRSEETRSRILYGGNSVGKLPENAYGVGNTHGIPGTCLLYRSTAYRSTVLRVLLGSKGLKRRSYAFAYGLLYLYWKRTLAVLVTYPYGHRVYPYYCTKYLCAKTPEESVRTLRTKVRTDS